MGLICTIASHPGPFTSRIKVLLSIVDNAVEHWNNVRTNTATSWAYALPHPRMDARIEMTCSTANRNLLRLGTVKVPFFAGFLIVPFWQVLIIQFPGELVELVDDGHLGVEDLVEAVSHEVGILVGSVTSVDEILKGVDNQVVHRDALVLGDVLDPSFHTASDGDVELLFRGC